MKKYSKGFIGWVTVLVIAVIAIFLFIEYHPYTALGSDTLGVLPYKVKITGADTSSNYLQSKLVAGSNVTITKNNAGGNETLTIASTGGGGGGGTWGSITGTLSDQTDLQTALNGKVPTTRTLTINGTALDLSANRSWTVGDALVASPLSQFASTTSLQLKGVISDETGSGALVFATSPVFTTPNIGSATGSISGNAGTATALAANGTNCSAGSAPLGVDASGNSEGCTAYEVPLTFSTGLTRSTNTITVNTSQNIATLSNLTSNGFVKTSGSTGALSIDTNTYLTGNQSITLSGDVSGSGTTAITTAIGAGKVTNTMLAGSIAASKLVGSDIATVGTITTGTWNGTTIDFGHGGTGLTTALDDQTMVSTGSAWVAKTLPDCTDTGGNHLNYTQSTNAFSCGTSGSGGGGSLTVGTTTIASGVSTKVLFDNAGTLGEYTISGSGNVAMTTSPVFTTPNLGTPSAVTLTNGTGLPISGITGLGTGIGTWLATPSSANLATAITDETGSGVLVFGTTPTLATPVINGLATGTGVASAATASTLATRDASANLSANNVISGWATTATAAGTTTLTITSAQEQFFTGVTTQTVKLPTTSVVAGQTYTIRNQSTGAVTVQSSGANTITILAANTWATFTALVATPTTAANWDSVYSGIVVSSGKSITSSVNVTATGADMTLTGSGANTFTFPAATDTLVGRASTDTLTNKTFDTAGTGNVFKINGTGITAVSGSGSVCLTTNCALTTPTLGAATATTINKLTITAPTTSATLTVVDGSSLITSGAFALTLTSTATSNATIPAGTNTLYSTKSGSITSSNLTTSLSDETGSGFAVFGTAPSISGATLTTSTVNGVTLTTGGSATTFLNGAGSYTTPTSSSFDTQDVPINEGGFNMNGAMVVTSNSTGTAIYVGVQDSSTTATFYRLAKDASSGDLYVTNTTTLTDSGTSLSGMAVAGSFLYTSQFIGGTASMRRYSAADLSGVTTMSVATSHVGLMFSDGTDLYIANGTADTYDHQTISGTTLSQVGTVAYTTSGSNPKAAIANSTNVWISDSTGAGTETIRKYAMAGGAIVSTTSPLIYQTAYLQGTNPFLFLASSSLLGMGWGWSTTNPTSIIGSVVHFLAITLP